MMIGQPLRLLIDGLPERWSRVAWRRGFDHGMAFEAKFKLDELAAHALALQPLHPAAASDDDIKKAYRRLAAKHHPDRHQGSEAANIATAWLLAQRKGAGR